MKIPDCKVCGVSLKCQGGKIKGRVLISKKGQRNWPDGYCFDHAPRWDSEYARMVEYGEERWHEIGGGE